MWRTVHLFVTFGQQFAIVTHHLPVEDIFVEVREVEPVFHPYGQIVLIDQGAFDVLIDFFHFE